MLVHFSHHLLAALLIPLLPLIRDEFALDYTQAGWLVSAFALSYGISQLPAGWLADRIGPRRLITIGVSGVATAGLLVGLSPTYMMMVIFLVLLGVMGGGYHPSASPLVSASVESKNQGRALGVHQIGGSASFFLAPLIAVAIAATMGWRGAYITLAIPIIIFGLVFYVFLGRLVSTRKVEPRTASSDPETPATPGRRRRLVAFITLSVAIQVLTFSTISFIPLFAVDRFGASAAAAAALLALAYSGGIWAGLLGGYLSDRFGRVPVILVVSLVAGPVVYLLNLVSLGWSIWVVLIAIGLSTFITMPVSESYIINQTSKRNRSTVLGIYYFASRGGPGVIAPGLGYLIDRFGFNTGFTTVSAVLLVVAIGCSLLLWRSRD